MDTQISLTDVQLAHALADRVDELTMRRFKAQDLVVEHKPDTTEVTDADKEAELIVRTLLAAHRPTDQIIGEEFGSTGEGHRQWVIDPIDGTSNFVRGVPVWATLIGLIMDGKAQLGLVSAPALGKRWWAEIGSGAFTGSLQEATPIQVSKVAEIQNAFISIASMGGWTQRGKLTELVKLLHECWRSRAFGDFFSYMLLAEGAVDIAMEPELNLHDMVALVPIVQEAGGRFTDLQGVDGPFGGNALATNGLLHTAVLERLDWQSAKEL